MCNSESTTSADVTVIMAGGSGMSTRGGPSPHQSKVHVGEILVSFGEYMCRKMVWGWISVVTHDDPIDDPFIYFP